MFKKKDKYVALFVIDVGGIFQVLGSTEFNLGDEEISFKDKLFPIIVNSGIVEGRVIKYYFNYKTKAQYFFEETSSGTEEILTSELMDAVGLKHAVSQLLKASELKKDWTMIIMSFVAGAGMFAFIGYLCGVYI